MSTILEIVEATCGELGELRGFGDEK